MHSHALILLDRIVQTEVQRVLLLQAARDIVMMFTRVIHVVFLRGTWIHSPDSEAHLSCNEVADIGEKSMQSGQDPSYHQVR